METAFDFIDELKRVIYEKCKLLSYWRTVRHLLLRSHLPVLARKNGKSQESFAAESPHQY